MKTFILFAIFLVGVFLSVSTHLEALNKFEQGYASLAQAGEDLQDSGDTGQGFLYHDESYDGYFNDDLGTGMGSRWYNMPSGR